MIFFFIPVEFNTSISERPSGTKCFTFSKIIIEYLPLICNGTKFCPLRNAWLLVDVFALNKHMRLFSLEVN